VLYENNRIKQRILPICLLNHYLTIAENSIDDCIVQNKSIDELKIALRNYWTVHMSGVEGFLKS
jgi:hypothetical protein